MEHYLQEGVEHFYLIDNGSKDNYYHILEKHQKYVTLFKDDKKYSLIEHYNNYILPNKDESEWLIIVDLDEFIYSRNEFKTITQYLRTVDELIGGISINWKMFGSNGQIKQPKSVKQHFNSRICSYMENIGWQKQILRTSKLIQIDIHNSVITFKTSIFDIVTKEECSLLLQLLVIV